jgi:hypothetical protein
MLCIVVRTLEVNGSGIKGVVWVANKEAYAVQPLNIIC